MNKEEILNIIESTIKDGDKTPGLFDLPKIMGIKSELQSCSSINDVLGIINEHRNLLSKAFGLSDEDIDGAISKIKAIEG